MVAFIVDENFNFPPNIILTSFYLQKSIFPFKKCFILSEFHISDTSHKKSQKLETMHADKISRFKIVYGGTVKMKN